MSGVSNTSLIWSETTQTHDPQITINGQTAGHSGTLAAGETVDLSVDESWIEPGRNNVSISTQSPSDGPVSLVGFDYRHDASTTISTTATATQFASSYNVSHSYRDATEDATVLLPFSSDRVVDVHTLQYRLDGGSWQSMSDADYQFNGSEITADISAAEGGELPEDTTVDVRATGRKIEVDNGAVQVTEATAPGDELDTKLRIDSKSEGFQINVGPTESGSRVHYGLSDDFGGSGPDGSAVIEANGDQHVQFDNALPGDSVRMKHLKTKAMPESGDVRVSVEKAGSTPELDISPGPGGAGDPVEFEYYRTQTGVEYLLQSITDGIQRDSDVAESPAILQDDDSDELLSILQGGTMATNPDGGGSADGIIGPIQTQTGMEIPISGVQTVLGLLAVGLGATLYFRGPNGFGSISRAGGRVASSARSSIPLLGRVIAPVIGGVSSLLSLAGNGLLRVVGFLRVRPRLAAGLAAVLSLAGVGFGVIPLPIPLVFAVGVPVVLFVGLREIGRFNVTVWAVSSLFGFIGSLVSLGVSFDGLINEQTSLILALGGLYLAYQVVQTWRRGNLAEAINSINSDDSGGS
jgi:hypothetical protein